MTNAWIKFYRGFHSG